MENHHKVSRASISSSSLTEDIDRISSLPDDILHKILSFLYIFDVVRLSVLSKRWNHIWLTIPYLDFNVIRFRIERRIMQRRNWKSVHNFSRFIYRVLNSQSESELVHFRLCSLDWFDKLEVSGWMKSVTMRNVQEIELSFCPKGLFKLPRCVSACESLRVLKLQLDRSVLFWPSYLGFCQLRLLQLTKVEFLDKHLTNRLFSECPLLETLILFDCNLRNMTLLNIASKSLVSLHIGNRLYCESFGITIKISCPNLKVFKYSARMEKDIIMENLLSIKTVHICLHTLEPEGEIGMFVHKMIKNVPSTSTLKLSLLPIQGLFRIAQDVGDTPVMFDKLKCLKLKVEMDEACMEVMLLLLKHSPYLEVLNLVCDANKVWDDKIWKMQDPSESIVCLESHLKTIRLTGFTYEENEDLLRFFLKNALVLEKLIVVWTDPDNVKKSEMASEVLKYPRSSPHVVVTFS